jgi:hypothetical protein
MQKLKNTSHLKTCIRNFADKFPSFTTKQGAYNKCKFASYELVLYLRQRGFAARLIHIKGCPTPSYPEPHLHWATKRRDRWSHYVVGIGRWTVDLTARQFDSKAEVPLILPLSTLRAQWTLVEDDTFLNKWVTEVLRHKDLV